MITLKNELFSGITKPPTKYNGRYIKIESIGSGSFGKIKKVKDTLSNEEIYKVIKIFFIDNVRFFYSASS